LIIITTNTNLADHPFLKKAILKRILLTTLILFPLLLSAQVKRPQNLPGYDDNKTLHFGFTVGLNTMDMGIGRSTVRTLNADITNVEPGFQVSIVSDLRLAENWNMRFLPGIAFGQRTMAFYSLDYDTLFHQMSIESSYLDFPLSFKYRAQRLNNYRPYMLGGLNFRYDLAAGKDFDTDKEIYIRFKPADIYLELGFGIDLYLMYFKFSPELKVSMGMLNVMVDDPAEGQQKYTESISRLNSYIVSLCFHFE
jgi:hypothetical protein